MSHYPAVRRKTKFRLGYLMMLVVCISSVVVPTGTVMVGIRYLGRDVISFYLLTILTVILLCSHIVLISLVKGILGLDGDRMITVRAPHCSPTAIPRRRLLQALQAWLRQSDSDGNREHSYALRTARHQLLNSPKSTRTLYLPTEFLKTLTIEKTNPGAGSGSQSRGKRLKALDSLPLVILDLVGFLFPRPFRLKEWDLSVSEFKLDFSEARSKFRSRVGRACVFLVFVYKSIKLFVSAQGVMWWSRVTKILESVVHVFRR